MRLSKNLFLFFSVIFLFLIIPNIVSADPVDDLSYGLKRVIEGFFDVIKEPLSVFIGESDTGSEGFLAKTLFLIIIFSLIWVVLKKIDFFGEHSWALWLVSLSVSILSVRWLGDIGMVKSILLPYSTFGVAITAGLPFILFFFFVQGYSAPIRKVSWIFFGVIFIGLWAVRRSEINMASASFIYLGTAILSFAMLWLDGTIDRWKKKMSYEANKEVAEAKMRARVVKMRNELMDDLVNIYRGDVKDPDFIKRDAVISKLEKKYGIK